MQTVAKLQIFMELGSRNFVDGDPITVIIATGARNSNTIFRDPISKVWALSVMLKVT